jgi:hypothetical protein
VDPSIIAATMALMVNVSPPGRSHIKDARESADEGRARYEQIAEAAWDVASERPLFDGPRGVSRTVALLLVVAHGESGFRRDVDLGQGPLARGSGKDSCLMQVRTTDAHHRELTADRRACFREGALRLKRSMNACRRNPPEFRLAAYGSGRCTAGLAMSRVRWRKSEAWARRLAAR